MYLIFENVDISVERAFGDYCGKTTKDNEAKMEKLGGSDSLERVYGKGRCLRFRRFHHDDLWCRLDKEATKKKGLGDGYGYGERHGRNYSGNAEQDARN